MITEPTAAQRQRQAFSLLRNQSRNAHIAGDGLLVAVLCHTGLHSVAQLQNAGKLQLHFSELYWLPIFSLYWLVDPSERYVISETLGILQQETEEDKLLSQWIDRYRTLIAQPLAGPDPDPQALALKDFAWPDEFAERSPEVETLLTHIVELAWFHGPSGDQWQQIAEQWLKTAPPWSRQSLGSLRERLLLQTSLTAPEKPQNMLAESAATKLRSHDQIAELWLLHLHGRSEEVCKYADRLAPFLSAESHRWRAIHDFIHYDSKYGSDIDSQGIRLARRRRMSVETPLLLFHDARDARLSNTLSDLFRTSSKSNASKRWEIYILARLHELAALRLWDYGMWLKSISVQAQANLEVVQWTDEHPDMSVQGLTLAARSLSAHSPDKDSRIRRAIDNIEFAPVPLLSCLGESLLATYPRQKHSAAGLLQDLTDLLPPDAWSDWARWTITYIQESSEKRTTGWKLAPATHWLWVLGVLPKESEVYTILQPELLAMSRRSECWLGEYGTLLQRWLLFAPPNLAREVAEAITSHAEDNNALCFIRSELLIEFERWNPSLHGFYTRRVASTSRTASESLILSQHLEEPDVANREDNLRGALLRNIREAISQATLESPPGQRSFSPVVGIHLIKQWRLEDQTILDELINAVESENLMPEAIPWLLVTIQLLVAHGPEEFSRIAQPKFTTWASQLLNRRDLGDQHSGPLSLVQYNSNTESEVASTLGWLVLQFSRKLGAECHPLVLTWAHSMLLLDGFRPLDIAIYCCAVVGLRSSAATSQEALMLVEAAILVLFSSSTKDRDALQYLANALRRVATLIDSELPNSTGELANSSSVSNFYALLSRVVPRLSRCPSASVRSAVALIVWKLKRHGYREGWVLDSLENFRRDNRARVRFEADGGWEEAKRRAVQGPSV